MHDAVTVAVVERPQGAVDDLESPFRQQAPVVAEQVAQGAAVHVLHHDVRLRCRADHVLAGVVHGDDGRVVEGGGRLGFPAEAGLEGRVAGQVVTERLDSDDTVQANVTRAVDLGHAAAPDDTVEFVAATEEPGLSHVSHFFATVLDPGHPCGRLSPCHR